MNPIETTPQNELAKIAIATIRDRGHLANFNTKPCFCATIPINDDPFGPHVWVAHGQVTLAGGMTSFSISLEWDNSQAAGLDEGGYKVLRTVVKRFLQDGEAKIDQARKDREIERAVRVLSAINNLEAPNPEPRIEGAYSDALAGESLDLRHKYCEVTETFNGVTFKDFERYARTVAYKVAKNLANGHEMDWSRSPLNK